MFIVAVLHTQAAYGQSQRQPPDDPRVAVSVGYEAHVDRLRYTFENPSAFNTTFLVPHAFTQSYAASNQWITGSLRYRIGGDFFSTELAITPEHVTSGSDFDTFYNPDGNVIVYGTDGDVRLRSLRVAQWSETKLFGLPWRLGYRYRRDRSQYLPTDRIITQTMPPSIERSPTFGRETTISDLHAVPIEVSRTRPVSPRWTLTTTGEVAPIVLARLTTRLPDKYPGQDIIFSATALGYGAAAEMVRGGGRWPLHVSVRYSRLRRYTSTQDVTLNSLQVAASVDLR